MASLNIPEYFFITMQLLTFSKSFVMADFTMTRPCHIIYNVETTTRSKETVLAKDMNIE